MKTLYKIFTFLFVFGLLASCNSCKSDDDVAPPVTEEPPITEEPGDTDPSQAAIDLLNNLKNNANQGNILLGHQATTIAGVGWRL